MNLIWVYEDHNTDLFPFYYFIDHWVYVPKLIKNNISEKFVVFSAGTVQYYVDKKSYPKVGMEVFEYIFNKGGIKKIGRKVDEGCRKILEISGRLKGANFRLMPVRKLISLYAEYEKEMNELNDWGTLYGAMEFGEEVLSTKGLKEQLAFLAKKHSVKEAPEHAMAVLMAPRKGAFMRKMKSDVLKLGLKISKRRLPKLFSGDASAIEKRLLGYPEILGEVEKLRKDYEWINYGYQGPLMGLDYFISQVKQVLQGDVERELSQFESEFARLNEAQMRLERRFHIGGALRRRFEVLRELSYQKFYRKEAQFLAFHAVEGLQMEIARRLGLSLQQLRYFAFDEVMAALRGSTGLNANLANERMKLCIYYFKDGKHRVISGREALRWMRYLPKRKEIAKTDELRGDCASPGKVQGRVRIVMNAKDIVKVQRGDVLVSFSTNPQMVPGMRKAGAIVTDQGGVTCHAAIVSRELKIPCVIGTKVASRVLRDGDRVVVDATNGIVKKIK
ncbi:MAG TPA: PEP-utilizing enzyme [Candidatus Norongarragalinales archaeon]|nr:PEP-utilizing enzyme [Candidatus Norongarragalinales archaeon]